MNKLLKNLLFLGLFAFLVASPVAILATPQTTYAANAGNCETTILGIPPWYRGIVEEDSTGKCSIVSPSSFNTNGADETSNGLGIFIWKIVLNVIQIALVLASWLALFFILYGGFMFITSGGNASQVEKARKSIFNAVIGLVISMGAIAITSPAFGVLGDATAPNAYGVPEISAGQLVQNIVNLVYYTAGIVAVIVIVIAGIMYGTSMGDASRVARAKNMILYSVIGLVILVAAFAITNFVMDRF